MKQRELERLAAAIGSQPGVRVRQTKAGWYFTFPNGRGTSLHRTLSDWRALKNFQSTIQQAGLTWPGKKRRSTR